MKTSASSNMDAPAFGDILVVGGLCLKQEKMPCVARNCIQRLPLKNAENEVLPRRVSDSRYFHWRPWHNYDLPINKSYEFAYFLCLCRRSHRRQLMQMRWAHPEGSAALL